MKVRLPALCFCSLLLFSGCFEDPDFNDAPRLTNISVSFKEITETTDSLIISVEFEDGDGDLGIIPFSDDNQLFTFIPNPANGEPFWIYDEENPDPALPEFSCALYSLELLPPLEGETRSRREYVRADYNEDYYNYSIALFVLNDGEFQEVDLVSDCDLVPLGMRFPLLEEEAFEGPLQGSIQYRAEDFFLRRLYRQDTLKMGVIVRDRAGNASNMILSEPFTIEEATERSGG